ncbi:MAG: hypothetical protein U5N86_09520 [Planctomycetota bacterium]|nr:hypothetical protein [Planctomycetota bacterium]
MTPLQIVLLVCGILVVVFTVVSLVLRFFSNRTRKRAQIALEGHKVLFEDRGANCIGVNSPQRGTNRGNGYLFLTEEGLLFLAYVGYDIEVSYMDITEVGTKRSQKGKSIFRELLSVTYTYNGSVENAAWYTGKLEEALTILEKALAARDRARTG